MPMSDVFHYVRTQYEEKPRPREETGPGHHKALARNKEWFITELPDKWLVDYERRKRHQHTGYFAFNYLPYKTFANLKHTDVYDLLGEHLEITVNKQYAFMTLQNFTRNQTQALHSGDSQDTAEPLNTIVVVCDGEKKSRESLPPSRYAGLSSIRTTLSSNNRLMKDMAAGGTSFREAVLNEEKRAKYLKNMRAAKPAENSSGAIVSVHNPSSFLSPMVFTASSKTCLFTPMDQPPVTVTVADEGQRRKSMSERPPAEGEETAEQDGGDERDRKMSEDVHTSSVGPNLYVALAAAHFKLHHHGNSSNPDDQGWTRKGKQRENIRIQNVQKRLCLAKLKSVYAILCCLNNIKMRDLRSREPLSYSVIKAISLRPLHSLNKDYHTHHHHHHHVDLHHHHSPTPHYRHTPHTPHPHTSTTGTDHSLIHQRPTHNNLHNKHHGGHGMRHVKPHPYEPQIETWEEMKEVHEKGGVKPHTGTSSNPALHGQNQLHHYKPTRVLPPWQRQLIFVDDKEESLKKDPAKKLCEQIESFHYFKSEQSQQMKTTLADRRAQMEKRLTHKLSSLSLGVNTNQCLEDMREEAYRIGRTEREQETSKPTWYSLLEEEVRKAFGEDLRDRAGAHMLEKLRQFIFADNKAVPYVAEKFCLLVMSVPAYQLVIQPVISAMELVLEHVLNLSPNLFSKLKAMRDLPTYTTTELDSPAYVFGMHV